MDTQISKNITKNIVTFDNADRTYSIEAKDEYCKTTSLNRVYDEIKHLLTTLFNEKGEFYYKITSHVSNLSLINDGYRINKIKSYYLKYPSDSHEFAEIISMLSYDFHNLIDAKIFNININIYYRHNKIKYDSDSD